MQFLNKILLRLVFLIPRRFMARSWLDHARKPSVDAHYSFHERKPRFPKHSPFQCRHLLFLTGIVAFFIFIFSLHDHQATSKASTYFTQHITHSARPTNPKELASSKYAGQIRHVLSPADKGNADTCKLVLSAAINEYELITFYNWHKTGNKMAKVSGGLEYMSRLDPSHDEELLLIVDGFDEWFQLPSSIMEARYHEINRRENERILARTGRPYKQSIVISTQRQCWPGNSADISCYAAPESPLPAFVFGPETDNMVDGWNTYSKLRPRYMNAGYTMGPVKEMRELWTRAQEYAEDDPNVVGLDQNILARIWGEQNYVREAARFNDEPLTNENLGNSQQAELHDKKGPNSRRGGIVKRGLGFPDDKPTPSRKKFAPRNNTNYEFGIGLDYGSELSLPTVFAEYDADWLTFSNKTSLTSAFNAQNVTHPGASHLQNDIADLPSDNAPFASLQSPLAASEPKKALREVVESATWHDVPLFTNMWTGITPAIVHHNAWRDGLKDRRRTTWDKMWYQPYARELLDAWSHPGTRTTSPKVGASAKFRRFLGRKPASPEPPRLRELGAKTDNDAEGNWVRWGDLCTEESQKEVFRDEVGVWVGPGGAGEKKLSEEQEKKKEVEEGMKSMIVHNEPVR